MCKLAGFFVLAAVLACAQTPASNFNGVWELNKTKSPSRTPDSMRLRIEQQGSHFTVTARATNAGQTEENGATLVVGETTKGTMHGAPMTSQTAWDGATLVVKSVAMFGNQELRLTDRYTLSADGSTLTYSERHQFGKEPEAEDVRMFDRNPSGAWGPLDPPKPAEEVFKNIQILKGVPAPRVQLVMNNLTKWLGVRCEHCHDPNALEKDDKAPKVTARKMFLMVRALNHESFGDSGAVTCWTCHRGAAKPQTLPPQ
jgi:hypothetical protein